jgi:hypothetical protein
MSPQLQLHGGTDLHALDPTLLSMGATSIPADHITENERVYKPGVSSHFHIHNISSVHLHLGLDL